MAFQKGHKLATGRPKGSKNQNRLIVEIIANKYKQHPFEILMNFATGDWQALGYDNETYVLENAAGGTKIGYTISPEMRLAATKEACQYLVAKRKEEIDEPDNEIEVMDIEQKKEFIQQAEKDLQELRDEVAQAESHQIEAPIKAD